MSAEQHVYPPSTEAVKGAWVSGMPAYQALVDEAARDYEGYWARLARELAPCAVIASGGVSRIEDLDALIPTGATAVVIGKAFYEGAFTVEQALARVAARSR